MNERSDAASFVRAYAADDDPTIGVIKEAPSFAIQNMSELMLATLNLGLACLGKARIRRSWLNSTRYRTE